MTQPIKKFLVLMLTLTCLSCIDLGFISKFLENQNGSSSLIETTQTSDQRLPNATQTPTLEVVENYPTIEPQVTCELNPEGPYLLFGGREGIWLSNPDGRCIKQVFEGRFFNNLRTAVAPDGSRMALVTQSETGYDLNLITLPDGQQKQIIQLLEGFGDELDDPKSTIEEVLTRYNNTTWLPWSGDKLAFVGAINSTSTNIFVYDIHTRQVDQLTEDPLQTIHPTWSPDGRFILYYGVSWVGPFEGAIAEYDRMNGAWAIDLDNERVVPLPKPEVIRPDFVGWQDGTHYFSCDGNILSSVDLLTGSQTEIIQCCCYDQISQSPIDSSLLLNYSLDCSFLYEEGIFLLSAGAKTPQKIFDTPAWELEWLPESNFFFAYPEALISSDGKTIFSPPVYDGSYLPAVSQQGYQAWLTFEDRQPSVRLKTPGDDWQVLIREAPKVLVWDPDSGQTLLMVLEDGRLLAASYPDFTPYFIGNLGSAVDEAIYIP